MGHPLGPCGHDHGVRCMLLWCLGLPLFPSLFKGAFACGPHLLSLNRVRVGAFSRASSGAWLGLAAAHASPCDGLFTRLCVNGHVASLFTDGWGQHLPSRREVEPKAAGLLGSKRGQAYCCYHGPRQRDGSIHWVLNWTGASIQSKDRGF